MNLAYQRWFFWDGRADRLWAQALGPIENELEMNSHRALLAAAIAFDPILRRQASVPGALPSRQPTREALLALKKFKQEVCAGTRECQSRFQTLTRAQQLEIDLLSKAGLEALEAFQLTLISPRSRFDQHATSGQGLDESEYRGMKLFFGEAKCSQCHSGPALTDGGFHNLLLPASPGRPRDDSGRFGGIEALKQPMTVPIAGYEATQLTLHLDHNNSTWGQFKTPSIRNLSGRSEFMHNGIFKTLREVLDYYNTLKGALVIHHHQNALLSPLNLHEAQLQDLEAFLNVFARRDQ